MISYELSKQTTISGKSLTIHVFQIENFTVSFSDGRALCHIVHYYHPGLLPLDQIKNETGMTHMENMEKNANANMNSSCNDSFNTSAAAFGGKVMVVYSEGC